jgi:hypothetical protein
VDAQHQRENGEAEGQRKSEKGKQIEARAFFSLFPFAPSTTPAATQIDSHTHTMILARLCSDLAVEKRVEWSATFSFFAVFSQPVVLLLQCDRSLLIACALAGWPEQARG